MQFTKRYRIGDIRHCFADMSNTEKAIGPAAQDSFRKSIQKLVEWVRQEKVNAPLEESIGELSDFGLTGQASSENSSE